MGGDICCLRVGVWVLCAIDLLPCLTDSMNVSYRFSVIVLEKAI